MSIGRTILRPIAYVAGLHASTQVRAFLHAHHDTAAVQHRVLTDLLASRRDTAFGRDHGLASVRSVADFRWAVPVRGYEQLEPYFQRVLEGEPTALLPANQPVLMFSRTSGTTGRPKHIPVTPEFLGHMRRGWNTWGRCALKDHPRAWLRSIVQLSSPMREADSPTGLPCGAISGLLAATQKRIVQRMYCVPAAVAAIEDPRVKAYVTFRCAASHDVAFITTANPSSTIKLIETAQQHADRLAHDLEAGALNPPGPLAESIRQQLHFRPAVSVARRLREGLRRDGQLMPRHLWRPAFLANWTGGTLGLYLPRLRELFDGLDVRDVGLLASEGRFSVPLEDNTPAGVAEILGNFLEFIPAGQHDHPNPGTLLAHELEVGQEYFLVVTNCAGLWRYNLDDRIRVTGRFGQSPVFEFLCRGTRTANITGEKLTERQVIEAMQQATAAGPACERFVLQGVFDSPPYYQLRLECPLGGRADQLAAALDSRLGDVNIEYAAKRRSGRLGPVRAVRLPPGRLEELERRLLARRQGRLEQYKHQYLLTDVLSNA